jgi:hypothetical protein
LHAEQVITTNAAGLQLLNATMRKENLNNIIGGAALHDEEDEKEACR